MTCSVPIDSGKMKDDVQVITETQLPIHFAK